MARRAHGIAVEIVEKYDGDTASIWTTAKSGDTLYKRVSSLPGFAEEKSQIFVALLAKRFDVKAPWLEGRRRRLQRQPASFRRRRRLHAQAAAT